MLDPAGQFVFLNIRIKVSPFTVATLYGPNVNSLDFLAASLSALDKFCLGPIILGGDLNLVADPDMDYSAKGRLQSLPYVPKSRRKGFLRLLE